MKVTIEGQVYDYNAAEVDNRTLMDVEAVTGMTIMEWEDALGRGSMVAITALAWLVLRENGQPDLKFEDVRFNPRTMDIQDVEEPGKDPTPEESPAN